MQLLKVFVVICACFIASLGLSSVEVEFICSFESSTNVAEICSPWTCINATSICVTIFPSCLLCRKNGSLETINLGSAQLNGTIPSQIGQLASLKHLDLSSTQLNGTIPTQIGQLVNLTYLDFDATELNGIIPTQIGQLVSLKYLDFDTTQLSGTIPTQIGQLVSLTYLDFDNITELNGIIPTQIGKLVSLRYLDLSSTQLNGIIPTQIGKLVSLRYLDFDATQVNGIIPTQIGKLVTLTYLDFDSTELYGIIPTQIGQLVSLTYLDFDTTQLSGIIPTQIGQLASLRYLDFDATQLNGMIPTQIGQLNKLTYLDFDTTQLNGTIPTQIGHLSVLQFLDFDTTQLSGTVPTQIGQLNKLTYFDLSSTQLNGTVPSQIGQLNKITYLSFALTQLCGCIPSAAIPLQVCSLPPNTFNCSCTLPTVCQSICVAHATCPRIATSKDKATVAIGEVVGIVVAIFVVVAAVVILLVIIVWRKKMRDESLKPLREKFSLPPEILWSFEEVKKDKQILKIFPKDTESYETVRKMFIDHLEGSRIIISEIYGVYSESLLNGFAAHHQKLTTRFNVSPHLFKQKKWSNQDPTGIRQWTDEKYTLFVNRWPWNANCEVKIIPQLHGTDFETAKAICKTGFADLALLDAGWYGSGIYFTDSGLYATPYFSTKKDPALIIAYVIPGNVYPVSENPRSSNSLEGHPLKKGYQAHYIITTSAGIPVEKKQVENPIEEFYSELVIVQEAQCVPAFIIRVDDSNLSELNRYLSKERDNLCTK